MQIRLWRAALRLRCPANCACALGHGPSSSAPFHSTPVAAAKWKAKFDYDKGERKSQQPSKNYARYIVRQKRSDAKRVLNEFLLKGGHKRNVQAEWESWYVGTSRSSNGDGGRFSDHDHGQPYHSGSGTPETQKQPTRKAKQNGRKRKFTVKMTTDHQSLHHTSTTTSTTMGRSGTLLLMMSSIQRQYLKLHLAINVILGFSDRKMKVIQRVLQQDLSGEMIQTGVKMPKAEHMVPGNKLRTGQIIGEDGNVKVILMTRKMTLVLEAPVWVPTLTELFLVYPLLGH